MQQHQRALGDILDKRLLGTDTYRIGLQHHFDQCRKVLGLDGRREIDAPAQVRQQLANARRDQRGGQRVVEHVVGRQAFLGQQRMPRPAEKYPALGRQRLRLEIRVGLEMADVGDEEFDLFAAQRTAKLFPVIHLKTGAHFRVGIDELRHRVRHQFHRWRRTAAEVHLAGVELGHLRHFSAEQRCALHQAQGVLQHHLALGRRAQILVAAIDQHATELLLQPLNAAAERRLSDAHGVGRTDKTAVFVKSDEVAQLAKIHMLFRHPKNSSKAFATRLLEVLNASSYSVNEACEYLLDVNGI